MNIETGFFFSTRRLNITSGSAPAFGGTIHRVFLASAVMKWSPILIPGAVKYSGLPPGPMSMVSDISENSSFRATEKGTLNALP